MKGLIDSKENEYIEAVSFVFDSDSKINKFLRGNYFINFRGIIENFKQNPDYLDLYENLQTDDTLINYNDAASIEKYCSSNKDNNCIMYNSFSKLSESDIISFNKYKKILKLTLPFMKFSFCLRNYQNNDQPFFTKINILSNKFDSVFYFPYSKPNLNYKLSDNNIQEGYNLEVVKENKKYYLNNANYNLTVNDSITNETSYLVKPSEVYNEYKNNPYLIYGFSQYFPRPFDTKADTIKYYSDTNILFNKDFQTNDKLTSLKDIYKLKNIEDSILLDIPTEYIEDYLKHYSKEHKGLQLLITNKYDHTNINNYFCLYFLKLYDVDMGYSNQTVADFEKSYNLTKVSKILDCFQGATKEKFKKYFMDDVYSSKDIVRAINFKFFKNLDISYKVFKYSVPTLSCDILIKTLYNDNYPLSLYTIKNSESFRFSNSTIFYHVIAYLFQIMAINLLIWIFILIIILVILFRVAGNISNPIKLLLTAINSIGRNKSNDEDIFNTIEEIKYPEDKDINDVFQICKTLIKGAFNNTTEEASFKNDQIDKQYHYLTHAYNNISFIKSNNFIIEEDTLESVYNKQSSIFNYEVNDFNKHNDDKPFLEQIKKEYYVEGVKSDNILEKERQMMFDLVETYNVDFESHPYYEYYQAEDLRILTL